MQNTGIDWIGWLSSVILLLTMGKQVSKQWAERSSKGVSKWLYLGQFAAEIGFVVYSFLVKNWVFVFTNVMLLFLNLFGLFLLLKQRRRGKAAKG